jgi:glycerol-3-phosphate cytidylyltransferase-like family protein
MTKEKILVTSGDFDPLSVKELHFLKSCREKGDWLIVGIHSDTAIHMKTGTLKQDYDIRKEILSNIKCVDEIFKFNDADGTVCNLLKIVKLCYPLAEITYVSEHNMQNMPEAKIRGINFEVLKK